MKTVTLQSLFAPDSCESGLPTDPYAEFTDGSPEEAAYFDRHYGDCWDYDDEPGDIYY